MVADSDQSRRFEPITRGANNTVICGQPCHYGGLSAARKYSASDLGVMWRCNRKVRNEGDRCWQHAKP